MAHLDKFDRNCVSLPLGTGELEFAIYIVQQKKTFGSSSVRKCLDIVTPRICCGHWVLCPCNSLSVCWGSQIAACRVNRIAIDLHKQSQLGGLHH